MRYILLIILLTVTVNAFSCSGKDQLSITIGTKNNNLPHKEYVSLGKTLFNDSSLSRQLHSYSTSINHSSGNMVFDIESDSMKKEILTKIKKILDKENLRQIRITYNKLQ